MEATSLGSRGPGFRGGACGRAWVPSCLQRDQVSEAEMRRKGCDGVRSTPGTRFAIYESANLAQASLGRAPSLGDEGSARPWGGALQPRPSTGTGRFLGNAAGAGSSSCRNTAQENGTARSRARGGFRKHWPLALPGWELGCREGRQPAPGCSAESARSRLPRPRG